MGRIKNIVNIGDKFNRVKKQFEVKVGEKYNKLTVYKFIGKNDKNKLEYLCKCDCGGEKIVKERDLVVERVKSCGCLLQINGINARERNAKHFVEVGKKYNKLTVLSIPDLKNIKPKEYERVCECLCECGVIRMRKISDVSTGKVKSCGCSQYQEFTKDPWENEIKSYHRRIKERGKNLEWNLTKEQFIQLSTLNCVYCGKKPEIKTKTGENFYRGTIDRIDSLKGYIIENCISCCVLCNSLKSNLYKDDFFNIIQNIYKYCLIEKNLININLIDKKSFNNVSNQKYEERILTSFKRYKEHNSIRKTRNGTKKVLEWKLSKNQYENLIMNICFYCGKEPKIPVGSVFYRNGIDRVDSKIGYLIDNCVTCCASCNKMKSNHSQEQFLEKIKDIYDYNFTGNIIV